MKWANLLRRWTMKSIHSAILGAALLGSASIAFAQTTPSAVTTQSPKHYTKSQTFDLPVQMDQADRLSVDQFRLYMRTPTTGWKLQDNGPNHLTRFSCRVTQDGEYWYLLATVDRAGRQSPADVSLEPPIMRVVVDTTAPVIQTHSWTSPDNEVCLRCTVTDANPDHTSLRAVCKTDSGDVPLDMVPNQPGTFRLKTGELARFPVVVTATDLARNVATKEVNVRDMVGIALTPKAPGNLAPISGQVDQKTVSNLPPPRTDVLPPPRNEPGTRIDFPTPPGPINTPTTNEIPNKLTPTPPSTSIGAVPHQLISTTRASIDYRLDQVGPSGVGKVEIYMTPDKGQTWHRLAESTNKRSPAEVDLPGDGVYGIRFVVTNGNGFGGKTPVRGDTPHCTVEVDTTAPFVKLQSTELVPSTGQVELRWNATDHNLGSEPVTLQYRTRPDGPWQVIAKNVKNDGVYRWAFPRDAGGQFYFKVEVTDKAGNMSQDVSRQAVVLDMSEPRVSVVGVTGTTTPIPGRSGN